jgi:membrane protein YdbS with pleckstrin-like domain
MRCSVCGGEAVPQAAYCHLCGHRLDSPQEPADRRAGDVGRAADGAEAAARADTSGRQDTPEREPLPGLVRDSGDEPEKELWRGGYSSKAMSGGWAICGGVTLLLLVGGVYFQLWAAHWLLLLLIMLLPWLYCFFLVSYRRLGVHYLLTTQRFVHESGILRRVTDRIEVIDIDDITFEQGPLERLLGVGTIRVSSSDRTHPQLELPGIENVKDVSERFDNARRAERRRRGLHIEQI